MVNQCLNLIMKIIKKYFSMVKIIHLISPEGLSREGVGEVSAGLTADLVSCRVRAIAFYYEN